MQAFIKKSGVLVMQQPTLYVAEYETKQVTKKKNPRLCSHSRKSLALIRPE
jgi:hypothetical protein